MLHRKHLMGMTGAESKEECVDIYKNLSKEQEDYGIHLRKWTLNDKSVTTTLFGQVTEKLFEINNEVTIKTLGLKWNPQDNKLIKRKILSTLARKFDPMGWLSPITIVAKLFIQKLWMSEMSWDKTLFTTLSEEWVEFNKKLKSIESLKIPRWTGACYGTPLEIHGFADASKMAYTAVIYGETPSGIAIITSKTKVNSIKNRKTLPKLELCAAYLLAKLLSVVTATIQVNAEIHAWSDSTITLGWIRNNINKVKFVRMRIEQLKELAPTATWRFVGTKENPAV